MVSSLGGSRYNVPFESSGTPHEQINEPEALSMPIKLGRATKSNQLKNIDGNPKLAEMNEKNAELGSTASKPNPTSTDESACE
ncbi:hypothetical protein VNO77_44118 [Canavalia gladiata]|uniref:Uncharacterized protein n=1 Tax=Canavalia gladiata TaxID=3824 RepID=A0AAN9JW31_CANGL